MGSAKSSAQTVPDSVSVGSATMDIVVEYFKQLQDNICQQLGELEPAADFREDVWQHKSGGGGGITRIFEQGEVFEKGGVNFSHVKGDQLPAAATAQRTHLAGKSFEAAGVSVVMHPRNPYVPCCHLNTRFFWANNTNANTNTNADMEDSSANPTWWFGGGYDLTPYYGFEEDCVHWHRTAKQACDPFGVQHYPRFKTNCDEYFYLKHRDEARGIGGLFFDDYQEGGFTQAFAFVQSIGNSFINAYRPIVERRRETPYTEEQRMFQCYRRGRYVEFNLVYDRGTLFGLESGGRTESILMSMPPAVQWKYDWRARAGSDEQKLVDEYLKPRDWLGVSG